MKKLVLILLFLMNSAVAFASSELNGTGIHYRIYVDGAEVTIEHR